MKKIPPALDSLLGFLEASQQSSGCFIGLASPDKSFAHAVTRPQNFHTGLIIRCLDGITDPRAARIRDRGVLYLQSQKSPTWSWNYWDRSDKRSTTIPDDLDDTSIALSAIDAADPSIIDEQAMVPIVQLLIGAETTPGGPYQTWITHNRTGPWHDIDMGVNANICSFLARKNIHLPATETWINERIADNDFSSNYYSRIALLYFLSSWYRGIFTESLRKRIIRKLCAVHNPLDTALLVSAYLGFGGSAKNVVRSARKLAAVSAKPLRSYPMFIESIDAAVPSYAGSPELTAAMIAQALHLYSQAKQQSASGKPVTVNFKTDPNTIRDVALRRFDGLPELQDTARSLIDGLDHKDPTHEIALLPAWFGSSLKRTTKLRVSQDMMNNLGAINTLGWIGYTIMDKVLDGEDCKGLLPVANVCIREVSDFYGTLFQDDAKAYGIVHAILDGIDRTNYWEHHNCKLDTPNLSASKQGAASGSSCGTQAPCTSAGKSSDSPSATPCFSRKIYSLPKTLPDYGDLLPLAEKSLGHALGPIAIILKSNLPASARFAAAEQVKQFFIHYIIARQLNDDAHDWLDDLGQGFLNSVSVKLFRDWQHSNPPLTKSLSRTRSGRRWHATASSMTEGSVLNLETDTESLQKTFWDATIDMVATDILSHAKKARSILGEMEFMTDTSYMEKLLIPLEESAHMAIRQRDSAEKFLDVYK